MIEKIVGQYNPDKIILFGSYARGDANADSDVDLLVVMPSPGSKRKIQVALRMLLHDIDLSKDLIVTSPEEFEWRKEIPGTIEYPAWHEGTLLYAKPA